MLDVGAILQNRYLIIRKIGQGGMGAVYEAKDQRLGVIVALKETIVTGDSLQKAFEREARLLAKLRHPALPVVSDYFFETDVQYLVMQYIDGKDLGQLLLEKGVFSLVEVLAWAERLLDALDYLHNQQPPIIHRDIKPNNLKLTDRGEIILLDFGLAKGSTTVLQNTNNSVSVYGYTPHYAPIEQVEGTGTDARSDLYALAATLYHLLTGIKPADAMPRVLSVVNGQKDPLLPAHEVNPRIPISISNLLASTLSQKRDERPANALAMKVALQKAIKATNDPNVLTLLNPTLKLNAVQTSEHQPLGTEQLDSNSKLATQIKTDLAINQVVITNPQPLAQETQLATQASATVVKVKGKNSKLPFVLAIGSVIVLACVLLVGLFFWPSSTGQPISVVALDAFTASKEQNKPTLLSAKEVLSKGLDEPRYYEFIAEAGEIKLTLNVVSNGATVEITVFDEGLKPLSFRDNTSLSLAGVNYNNEQIENTLLNPKKQKILLKLSNNYPNNLRAYRLKLAGVIELASTKKDTSNNTILETLATEFKSRDNPTPLTNNEIINPGHEKDLYYSFMADPGEIKLSLNVISNGATVFVELFDSDSKSVKYTSGTTKLSLSATSYQNEKSNVTILNTSSQPFLMRISQVYPNNLRAYRLSLKGPIKLSKDAKKTSFASLLAEFKDRDNPTVLANSEILNRGNEKDLYYTFRLQPGNLNLTLDLIANGSTLAVQFFDDKDQLMKFNSTVFSISSGNHNERKNIVLTNDRNQSVLMRISHIYPDSIKAYRIKLDGVLQIINPDPNANKVFESLAKLFDDRDNPTQITSSEILGTGNEKDFYYTFSVNPGELKLTVSLIASGGTLNIEVFDKNNNPILYNDKNQIFSLTNNENKNIEKSISAQINEKQNIVMRVSNTYPNSVKEYKIQLNGNLELPQTPAINGQTQTIN